MRLCIVHELAVNAEYYLENENLTMGLRKTDKNCVQAFASFSDHYVQGAHDLHDKKVIRALYKREVGDVYKPGSFMGIWQMFGLASVLKIKVCSVYPKISACGGIRIV